jgi:hypothetical protein
MDDQRYLGIYRGKVLATDVAESGHYGRIKVEVYPMIIGEETARLMRAADPQCTIEGISATHLPWATPATPLFVGAGDATGTFCVPDVGSHVWVFFEAGDIYQPVYFAEALSGVKGLPTGRETNYPSRRIIRTSSGVEIIIDDATGDVVITGANDVVVQGDTAVRINPLSKVV